MTSTATNASSSGKQTSLNDDAFPHPVPTNDNSNPQQGTGNSVSQPSATELGEIEKRFEQEPASVSNFKVPSTRRDARKLFVGGLPPDITEDEFRTFFEQFGTIVDSVVMFDRETRRSRGFGFVTFMDPEVAKSLLQTKNGDPPMPGRLLMRGKLCEVKAAEPKETSNVIGNPSRGPKGPYQSYQHRGAKGFMMDHHAGYMYGVPPAMAPQVMAYPHEHYPQQYGVPPHAMYGQPYYTGAPVPAAGGSYPMMYYGSPQAAHPGVVSGTPSDPYFNPAAAAVMQPYSYPYCAMPVAEAAPVYAMPVVTQNAMAMSMPSAMHPVAPGIPVDYAEQTHPMNGPNA